MPISVRQLKINIQAQALVSVIKIQMSTVTEYPTHLQFETVHSQLVLLLN